MTTLEVSPVVFEVMEERLELLQLRCTLILQTFGKFL
jgi:hypothetical protein